jgi:hypothetical protein
MHGMEIAENVFHMETIVAKMAGEVDWRRRASYHEAMSSVHSFAAGDFLIFQLEAGYGLLRVLDVEDRDGDAVWHLAAYSDLFLDPDTAEAAIEDPSRLRVELPHVALTNRAFESTQVSRLGNAPLTEIERSKLVVWSETDNNVSDRSIRLLLGVR